MSKFFREVDDTTKTPGASLSGSFRARIPANGRLMAVKTVITKGAALATLNEIRAALTQIRFKLGSDLVRKVRAADYLAILELNGYTIEAGELPIFFAEVWRATVLDEEMLGLEMRRYGDYIDFELDVTNTATALDFVFRTEVDNSAKTLVNDAGQTVPVFGMMDYVDQSLTIGGGVKSILLDDNAGDLQRLYIVTPNTTVLSRVKVLYGMSGDVTPYNIAQTALNPGLKFQLKQMGMKIPTAYAGPGATFNMWPVVFDNNQQVRQIIAPAGTRVRVELTLDVGADINIIQERRVAR